MRSLLRFRAEFLALSVGQRITRDYLVTVLRGIYGLEDADIARVVMAAAQDGKTYREALDVVAAAADRYQAAVS